MITVANRIYVKPEFLDEFAQRFLDRAGLVDQMPGFIANHVLRPVREGEPLVVLTFWESREALQQWTSSEQFKQAHARGGHALPPEAFSAPSVMELHEVISSSPKTSS